MALLAALMGIFHIILAASFFFILNRQMRLRDAGDLGGHYEESKKENWSGRESWDRSDKFQSSLDLIRARHF